MKNLFQKPLSILSIFISLGLSFFLVELASVFLMHHVISTEHHLLEVIVHSLILLLLISPFIFLFVILPLKLQIKNRIKSEMALMKQSKTMESINELLEESLLSDNVNKLATSFLKLALNHTNAQFGFIGLISDKQTLNIISISDDSQKESTPDALTNLALDAPWMKAIISQKIHLANNLSIPENDINLPKWHPFCESYLAVPLFFKDELIGILAVSKTQLYFLDSDAGFLEAIAPFFATALLRKINEAKIRANEEQLRTITTLAIDAIISIDDNDQITSWNKSAERMFGYPAHEIIGKKLHEIIAPSRYWADFNKFHPHFAKTGKGPIVTKTREIYGLKKSGEEFLVELSVSAMPLKNGNWGAMAIVRDVSLKDH